MDYVTFGNTRLRVSVAGLGCGGHSRLGQAHGASEQLSIGIVQRALDLGVNIIDTAEVYRTEAIVGKAIRGRRRDSVIVSTKKFMYTPEKKVIAAEDVRTGLEDSLQRLGTDYLDIYHLHAVEPDQYDYAKMALLPELMTLRDEGKIRFIGVTEMFERDTSHKMLSRAVRDGCFDVVMVGYNIVNQSARRDILPLAKERGIGVLDMFAVRNALSRPERLSEIIALLIQQGKITPEEVDISDPLGFLTEDGVADSIMEAAYRFCRYTIGIGVVLTGTGNIQHLEENVKSITKPPLPEHIVERLVNMFKLADSVSGN